MSSALDMSLDDIIKSNKKPNSAAPSSRGRGGRRSASGPGPGPSRRFPNRSAGRSAPYSKPAQAPDLAWDHDMFPGQAAAVVAAYPAQGVASAGQRGGGGSIETGTKLYISNLDYGVSNEDIKELFAEVGDLKRYGIHYDRSGRSKGTADVVFSRREEALAAVKRYNNVMLDGKPMKIEIVGTNILTAAAVAPAITDPIFRNQNGSFRSGGQGRGGAAWRGRGGGRGARMGRGRGRGGGRGRGRGENLSAEDLDAELDKYHSESMHTD